MRHLAGAVTVIATGQPGHRSGLTATAVCSLSDDPPALLVCVNRTASAHDLIAAHRMFSVNLLASGQEDVAARFAGRGGLRGDARFDDAVWHVLKSGAPVLRTALAAFDCEVSETLATATHTVFIGRVVGATASETADPLLYLRGGFRHVSPA
jgi:flavin reductase (DIM6/NTAB) family NADH-FMN oxidoreductase RutF